MLMSRGINVNEEEDIKSSETNFILELHAQLK